MRVTKIMEQYITERINAKYANDPQLQALENQLKKSQDSFNSELKDLKDKYTEEVEILLYRYNYLSSLRSFTFSIHNVVNPYQKELTEYKKARENARRKEIQDIIFKIELGNNKEAWDKLIEEE